MGGGWEEMGGGRVNKKNPWFTGLSYSSCGTVGWDDKYTYQDISGKGSPHLLLFQSLKTAFCFKKGRQEMFI